MINVTINICIIVQIVCATPTLKHKMLCINGFYIKPFLAISITHFPRIFRFVQEPAYLRIPLFPYFFVTRSIRKWLDHFPSLFEESFKLIRNFSQGAKKKREREDRFLFENLIRNFSKEIEQRKRNKKGRGFFIFYFPSGNRDEGTQKRGIKFEILIKFRVINKITRFFVYRRVISH